MRYRVIFQETCEYTVEFESDKELSPDADWFEALDDARPTWWQEMGREQPNGCELPLLRHCGN